MWLFFSPQYIKCVALLSSGIVYGTILASLFYSSLCKISFFFSSCFWDFITHWFWAIPLCYILIFLNAFVSGVHGAFWIYKFYSFFQVLKILNHYLKKHLFSLLSSPLSSSSSSSSTPFLLLFSNSLLI